MTTMEILLRKLSSVSVLWNNLRSIGLRFSIEGLVEFGLNPSGLGLFSIGRLLITLSIPLGDINQWNRI